MPIRIESSASLRHPSSGIWQVPSAGELSFTFSVESEIEVGLLGERKEQRKVKNGEIGIKGERKEKKPGSIGKL